MAPIITTRPIDPSMQLERLTVKEWQRLKAVRFRALADAPDAFGSTLEETERYEESDWRQQLGSLATYVVVVEGMDAGMVRGTADPASPEDAYLVSMWIAPEARGRGAGEALIQAIVDWARNAGHSRLLLDVADANQPAIRLYERMGFMSTGETGSLPPPREHITEHQRAFDLRMP